RLGQGVAGGGRSLRGGDIAGVPGRRQDAGLGQRRHDHPPVGRGEDDARTRPAAVTARWTRRGAPRLTRLAAPTKSSPRDGSYRAALDLMIALAIRRARRIRNTRPATMPAPRGPKYRTRPE